MTEAERREECLAAAAAVLLRAAERIERERVKREAAAAA